MDDKSEQFRASFEALLERWARHQGLPVQSGGMAATTAHRQLVAMGKISASHIVMVAGPDSAVEYSDRSATHQAMAPAEEIDHRGIKLPARHRAGGIITPQ